MREHQAQIIQELNVKPEINPAEEIEKRSDFLAHYLASSGLNGFVLGISGGQDSLLAGLLAQRAVEKRWKKGYEAEFHTVLLPYGTQADRDEALLAVKTIGPDVAHDFNIKPSVDSVAETYLAAEQKAITDYDKGNVKARMRMIAQYILASERGLLVIGTDHAAEAVTGFFTKFGDGAADVLPLSGLSKRQGKALLREFGAPEIFSSKTPTADLLDANPGQFDETELGLSYDTIDDYLEGKPVDESAARQIEARFDATRHKRALPVTYGDVE